jgi:hypothetical protein
VGLGGFLVWVWRFLRGNPGAVPIVGFEVLLVVCGVLLASGLSVVAEGLAVVAYFLLVVGVVVELVLFVREGGKKGG